MFPSCWSHTILPSIDRSTQLVWFFTARYPFLSCHPLLIHLESEQHFSAHSLLTLWVMWWSVHDAPSASSLHCLTTMSLCQLRDVLGGQRWVRLEMHLVVANEWVSMHTWRPRSSVPRLELGVHGQQYFNIHYDGEMDWIWEIPWARLIRMQ